MAPSTTAALRVPPQQDYVSIGMVGGVGVYGRPCLPGRVRSLLRRCDMRRPRAPCSLSPHSLGGECKTKTTSGALSGTPPLPCVQAKAPCTRAGPVSRVLLLSARACTSSSLRSSPVTAPALHQVPVCLPHTPRIRSANHLFFFTLPSS